MIRKYAILNNNTVTQVLDIDSECTAAYSKQNQLLIDITDMVIQPVVGYVLNGNKLEIPQGFSDRERYEELLNDKKCIFGTQLARTCTNKIGARNKILNKTGEQVVALLNTLLGIRFLLEGGALSTARGSCAQLKVVYTEYADIFDYVINEINTFELSTGL